MLNDGIHLDLPESDYHGIKFCSASHLSAFKRSPAHAREAMDRGRVATEEMEFGTAVHFAVLQPARFRELYTVADQCNGVTGKGKRCSYLGSVRCGGQWFCKTHQPADVAGMEDDVKAMSPDDFDRCLRMADAVAAHPAAANVLGMRTATEVTGIWTDAATGVRCKMRADILCATGAGIVGDLKTTTDAGRGGFERSIFKYGYYRQAAMYLTGLRHLGTPMGHFCILAVEKEAPFVAAVYRLRDDVVTAGEEECLKLLSRWAECERSGVWPGYSGQFEDIGLPAWGWKELEQVG